jgi:oligoendopeptidase F
VTTAVESGAHGVRWDLTPLAPSEEAMKVRLEAAVADAAAFVERWSAESLQTIEPTSLQALLRELADIRAARYEARYWAFMLTNTDSENPAVLDIRAWVDNGSPRLDDAIRHFELAWMALPDDRARSLAEDEAVARDRHYLLGVRRFRPFMLSPAEERALSARDASAGTAWQTLRNRTLGSLAARFDDGTGEREWPLSELESARRAHPDRDVRRRAQETTTALFEPVLPVIAHCYDSLVADRLAVDHLRGHNNPIDQTNLENRIDGGVVEALLAASEAHVEIAHRWFRRKASLLGLERLDAVDLQAAAAVEGQLLPWDEARRLVVDMFWGVTPALGAEAERFFSENRIDAEPRRGKPSGAFCVWPSTRVPGFVCVNWTGQLRDLVMLTHELGHGTNYGLAAQAQTDNSLRQGIALAEVPSTFAELLLVEHLLSTDEDLGRALLARELDQAVITVYMSAAFARFEQGAYALRAEGQALNADRLDALCEAALAKVWGDAVTDELGSGKLWWASSPHFVHERFYTYAYTFAFLLAAGLVARSREHGFAERYERFLTSDGSASPDERLAVVGVDLGDPEIWNDGFVVLEGFVERMC